MFDPEAAAGATFCEYALASNLSPFDAKIDASTIEDYHAHNRQFG
jgi:hypothetical protein